MFNQQASLGGLLVKTKLIGEFNYTLKSEELRITYSSKKSIEGLNS